jgi:hypothetical protein
MNYNMKRYLNLLALFFILSLFLIIPTAESKAADSDCLTMNVSLEADGDWPGGAALVRCEGRRDTCPGGSAIMAPGDAPVTLTGCNCLVSGTGESCLMVENIPSKCRDVTNPNQCGINGQSIAATAAIECETEDIPTPRYSCNQYQCVYDNDGEYTSLSQCSEECAQTPDDDDNPGPGGPGTGGPGTGGPGNPGGQQQLDCNSEIACSGVCSSHNQCGPGTVDQCIYTERDGSADCKRIPAANQPCSSNCQSGVCDSNNQCTNPPANTPKYICRNNSCERDDANGTTTDSNCNDSCRIVPPPTPAPPVPPGSSGTPRPSGAGTPRPSGASTPPPVPFSTAMCKCDGIQTSPLIAGQNVSITGFGKVEGADTSKAKIKDMTIYVAQDEIVIAKSDPLPVTVITNTAALKRYKSVWTYKLPAAVNPNSIYRIWTQENCQKQNVALLSPLSVPNLSFLSNIFGLFPDNSNMELKIVSTANAQSEQLKLRTLATGKVIQNSCRFVIFKFPNIQ